MFPTDLDNFTEKTDNVDDVMARDVNELQGAIESLEAKVGADSSAVTTSHDYKITKLEAVVNNASASAPASIDLAEDTDNGTNKITVTAPSAVASDKTLTLPDATGTIALLETVYPIGSVYTNYSDSTNPGTLLGIGTWVAIEGEVVVGFKSGDAEFGTAGGAVGAKTSSVAHTHTGPSHTHTGPSHTHEMKIGWDSSNAAYFVGDTEGGTSSGVRHTLSISDASDSSYREATTRASGTGNTGADGTGNTGAMSANATPSVIQPSRVCYVWRRSA